MGGGFIAIWIIFAVIAAYNGKNNGKNSARRKSALKVENAFTAAKNNPFEPYKASEKHSSEPIPEIPKVSTKDTPSVTKGVLHITKESTSLSEMEDRKHDWLAKQLADERRVLLRKDFLDLGAMHNRSCAANGLKQKHLIEHDDSTDDGEY